MLTNEKNEVFVRLALIVVGACSGVVYGCATPGGDICVGPSCVMYVPFDGSTRDVGADIGATDTNRVDAFDVQVPSDANADALDAIADVRVDTATDSARDIGADIRVDTTPDVGRDAGVDAREAAVDAAADAGASSIRCGTVNEGATLNLTCPPGSFVREIQVASYGTVVGDCPDIAQGACHAAASAMVVRDACVGDNICTVRADNSVFVDPCVGMAKRLGIRLVCAP